MSFFGLLLGIFGMMSYGLLVFMRKPLALSLIIPAYNEEQHISACLDSVAAQSVMPFEVIVVDNNSTDNSVKIACSYPFVRVVKARQQGIVYARDAGFDAAKGTHIGRIDADSILPSDWVKRVTAFYADDSHNATALTGGGRYYNVPLPQVSSYVLDVLAFRVNRVALGHHFLFGSNMVFPTAVWPRVKKSTCIRTDIHEDIDLAVHMHEAGVEIVYDRHLLVGVKLRRVFQNHGQLWSYLMLWPQSLRVHGKKLWPTGFFGAVLLYVLAPLLYPMRWLQKTIKR